MSLNRFQKLLSKLYISYIPVCLISCSTETTENQNPEKTGKKAAVFMSENTSFSASEIDKISISIPGVKCEICEENISGALRKADGIIEAIINISNKTAEIKYDKAVITPGMIRTAITNAGYNADGIKKN